MILLAAPLSVRGSEPPGLKPSPAAPAMASGFAPAHRGMGGPPRGGWENGRNNPGHGAPNYPDPFCRRRPSRFRERAWSVHPVRAPAASATDQPAGGPGGCALRQRSPSDRESLRARWGEGKGGGLWRTISVESPPRPTPNGDDLCPRPSRDYPRFVTGRSYDNNPQNKKTAPT